jgi:hypothetical protein
VIFDDQETNTPADLVNVRGYSSLCFSRPFKESRKVDRRNGRQAC